MATFSEIPDIPNRIARLEKQLSDEQRKRYEELKQKQAAERKQAQELLDRRYLEFHAEQRKHPLTEKPERLVRDRAAPPAFREAARKLIEQREIMNKLPADQERKRRDFLLQAVIEPSADAPQTAADDRRARMEERLAAARQKPSGPQRGGPHME